MEFEAIFVPEDGVAYRIQPGDSSTEVVAIYRDALDGYVTRMGVVVPVEDCLVIGAAADSR